jgi:hypothetical protein
MSNTWSIDDSSWVGASWDHGMKLSEEEYERWARPSQKAYDEELKRLNKEQSPDYDPWTGSYF